MPPYETFSKRQRRLAGQDLPAIYTYNDLPKTFRTQVSHIWDNPITRVVPDMSVFWDVVERTLARELGVHHLGASESSHPLDKCNSHLRRASTDEALDIIELSFQLALEQTEGRLSAPAIKEAVDELNHRFREHGLGYQFVGEQLIRVDSAYVHTEVVEPALILLHTQGFAGAEEEFLRAHDHFRKGNNKEAVVEALKAFESTMKTICDARNWPYPGGATAKQLISIVLDNGLIPSYMQHYSSGLITVLEAGLPTTRNKTSGHGQGSTPSPIPDYLAAYALHIAAANIVLLVEAHKATP
jgi:hypothetical protein